MNNTDFLVKASSFASQVDGEENLISLLVSSLGLVKERPNCTAEEHLNAMMVVAKQNNMLKHQNL